MVDVLVVFGSKSDSVVYDSLARELKKAGISFDLKICSAHRTPEKLSEILSKSDARVIVAGAGLSAALPGVIASHTLKPVIGLPLDGNYQGLDALLSVHQMPPGIPVLGVGVNNYSQAINAVKACLKKYSEVVFVENPSSQAAEKASKAEQLLQEFKIPSKKISRNALTKNCLALNFFDLQSEQPMQADGSLVINVPLADNKAEKALQLISKVSIGAFVGVGRGDNAALFALEVLGSKQKELQDYRLKQKQKVLDDNESESKRVKELM